jgi:hypothetical protein
MKITLSGIDERVSTSDLNILSNHAELAILYTHSPDGRNRYPSQGWIWSAMRSSPGRFALHVCGARARDGLHARILDDLISLASRVQVNGAVEPAELLQICWRYPDKKIITQHNIRNVWLLPVDAPNHEILVDDSGGNGRLPEKWERPDTMKRVGFAGGLGPTTIQSELPKFISVAEVDFWIDMEGQLRTDDWFDVRKAQSVIDFCKESHG